MLYIQYFNYPRVMYKVGAVGPWRGEEVNKEGQGSNNHIGEDLCKAAVLMTSEWKKKDQFRYPASVVFVPV